MREGVDQFYGFGACTFRHRGRTKKRKGWGLEVCCEIKVPKIDKRGVGGGGGGVLQRKPWGGRTNKKGGTLHKTEKGHQKNDG